MFYRKNLFSSVTYCNPLLWVLSTEEKLWFLIPCPSATAFLAKQTIGNHAFQNAVGSGLTDMEEGIDIAANDMSLCFYE